MKIAVSITDEGCISPLFDVSKRVWLGEQLPDGAYEAGEILEVAASDGESKIRFLSSMGVELLVCGAISRCIEAYARSYGIEVEPFLCGEMSEILDGIAAGNEIRPENRMPGCPGRNGLKTGCRRRAGRCAGRNGQSNAK